MSEAKLLPLFREGFVFDRIVAASDDQVVVALRPDEAIAPRCSGCGQPSCVVHDVTERRIRERDLLDRRTWLLVPPVRLVR